MPNYETVELVEKCVDAVNPSLIVLSGGNNISPLAYGSQRTDIRDVSVRRDAAERKLLSIALERDLKVLGICRGLQMINVYFGGKLCDLKNEVIAPLNHVAATHQITLEKITFMPHVKEGSQVLVNSYHDYGFTAQHLGQGLLPLARTDDQVIEMVKHRDFAVLGIMWHPERPLGDKQFERTLIKNFVGVGA